MRVPHFSFCRDCSDSNQCIICERAIGASHWAFLNRVSWNSTSGSRIGAVPSGKDWNLSIVALSAATVPLLLIYRRAKCIVKENDKARHPLFLSFSVSLRTFVVELTRRSHPQGTKPDHLPLSRQIPSFLSSSCSSSTTLSSSIINKATLISHPLLRSVSSAAGATLLSPESLLSRTPLNGRWILYTAQMERLRAVRWSREEDFESLEQALFVTFISSGRAKH